MACETGNMMLSFDCQLDRIRLTWEEGLNEELSRLCWWVGMLIFLFVLIHMGRPSLYVDSTMSLAGPDEQW